MPGAVGLDACGNFDRRRPSTRLRPFRASARQAGKAPRDPDADVRRSFARSGKPCGDESFAGLRDRRRVRAGKRRALEHELRHRAASCRLQAAFPDRAVGSRRRQELEERFGSRRVPRSHDDPGGEYGHALRLLGQRPDVIDARDRKQLADLLEGDLGFATRDERAGGSAVDHPALGANRVGDAEPGKQLRKEVDAARAR